MTESFLYFLWQYRYFATKPLVTTDGEPLQVLSPGFRNNNAGPDFTNARLLINDVDWAGTVEMHLKTSDWLAHNHQRDQAYDNVILHVVWQDDRPATGRRVDRADGTPMPTLELCSITSNDLVDRYALLTDTNTPIACAGQFRSVQPLRLTAMLDRVMLQRLERKATAVQTLAEQTNNDWEEVAYRLLAANMGFKTNADPMAQLSRAIPLRALLKHRDSITQAEAMLFGTAGLLTDAPPDEYVLTLQREYRFLAVKYRLADSELPAHTWKWGRMRPASFPTLRLAQFARLVTGQASLFSLFVGTTDVQQLLRTLQQRPSGYWQSRYRFGPSAERVSSSIGETSAVNIIINTVVPLLAAYAHHRGQPAYIDRAIALLEQLPAEQNHLTQQWNDLGLGIRTAFDSQASIELYNEYCTQKKCLNCQVGAGLVRG